MNAAQVTEAHIARVRAFGYTTEKGVQMAAQFIANNEAKLAAERTTLAGVIEIKRGVEAELAEMKRMLSSEKLMYKLANDSAIKHEWAAGELRNELAAERAKVRTLREALDEAQSCGGLTGAIFMQARAALAATEDKP
jgi:hypothetical protein